jgi:hypothetical protein
MDALRGISGNKSGLLPVCFWQRESASARRLRLRLPSRGHASGAAPAAVSMHSFVRDLGWKGRELVGIRLAVGVKNKRGLGFRRGPSCERRSEWRFFCFCVGGQALCCLSALDAVQLANGLRLDLPERDLY